MKVICTSPKEDIFFQVQELPVGNAHTGTEGGVINVFDEFTYQEIIGFGGAFTESSAYLYSLLTAEQKKDFMEKYFDREKGIGYNFGRTHIGSCDFSLDIYTHVQEGDMTLETFDISRDKKYIIPFLKDAMAYATEPINLFASPWCPPAYMKDNDSRIRGGKLREEFKALWAKYYTAYIKAFAAEGITIGAISVQNEPAATQPWESCWYDADDERTFIEEYLIAALDEAGMSDVKIIIWDHNKERVYDRAKKVFTSPVVRDKVWGVGFHWYSGDHFEGMRLVHEAFADKMLISSENCGMIHENPHSLAERYGKELVGNFANFTNAYCDWNLLLSQNGGPYHNRNDATTATEGVIYEDKSCGCHAPVLYDTEKKELIFTPIYYYIGHFSKFVQKGAVRIATTKYDERIYACGFKNPDGSMPIVVMNTADWTMPAVIRHQDVCTKLDLPAHSIATFIL